MKKSTRTLLSVFLFFLIFGALLAVATVYDLEISLILTENTLLDGNFYTDNAYANFFETMGMLPAYIGSTVTGIVLFGLFFQSGCKKYIKIICCTVAFGLSVYFLKDAFDNLFKYPVHHIMSKYATPVDLSSLQNTFDGITYFLSACFVVLALVAVRKVPLSVWKKMIWFVIAFSVMSFLSGEIVNMLKEGVGRVRFRTLYYGEYHGIGNGFDDYTPWYVKTANGELYRESEVATFHDAFNSFPSHHTRAAGMSYALIMLNDLFAVKSKKKRLLMWIISICWTGLTAVGRMVAGAHYFSDVLIGGTVAFVCMIVAKEIFICKFSHFGRK